MARDINQTYRKMAFDCGPVKSKELYDDLPKAMKDAYVTGKLAQKTKNYQARSFQRKRPGNFNFNNRRQNSKNQYQQGFQQYGKKPKN